MHMIASFHCRGTWVQSLVRELRSWKLHSMVQKKKKPVTDSAHTLTPSELDSLGVILGCVVSPPPRIYHQAFTVPAGLIILYFALLHFADTVFFTG